MATTEPEPSPPNASTGNAYAAWGVVLGVFSFVSLLIFLPLIFKASWVFWLWAPIAPSGLTAGIIGWKRAKTTGIGRGAAIWAIALSSGWCLFLLFNLFLFLGWM